MKRLTHRLGIPNWQPPPIGYTDRRGNLRLPFDIALELAQKFCEAEPSAVLVRVETTERKWTYDALHDADHLVPLLNQYRAAWALLRQWAGP